MRHGRCLDRTSVHRRPGRRGWRRRWGWWRRRRGRWGRSGREGGPRQSAQRPEAAEGRGQLAQLPRRVQVQPSRDRPRVGHQSHADHRPRARQPDRRHPAGRRRVRRQAPDRFDRQRLERAHARSADGIGDVGRHRARSRDHARDHQPLARHDAQPAPAAARAEDQRRDPREGADPRAHAVRGLGAVRQPDPCAPRGIVAAALARLADLRARTIDRHADRPRRAARRVLADRARGADRRRDSAVHLGAQVLRRCVPPVSLAHARNPRTGLRGDSPRPRRPREGSEAVRPRRALPRPLQGDLRQALRR